MRSILSLRNPLTIAELSIHAVLGAPLGYEVFFFLSHICTVNGRNLGFRRTRYHTNTQEALSRSRNCRRCHVGSNDRCHEDSLVVRATLQSNYLIKHNNRGNMNVKRKNLHSLVVCSGATPAPCFLARYGCGCTAR